ncbi:response regulator transcription factor [Isoptericola sp. S6320L]|uniref:response regulator n=1 Tax=Isoptericola sp. S6320L TaxID=2926411 RepID=UPI001FF25FE1|nr:response regulator transcription factor [Isoptericola sp. S6320L]MCK0117316.1 response regulator transcription factor [Isoptericola sp. S6320L]
MTDSISVVVVDDDALVRAGLGLILGGAPEVRVVGDAGDGDDGVELVRRMRPDVVLMDIRMPRMDGIEATRRIVAPGGAAGGAGGGVTGGGASDGAPRVIVLTTFDTDDMVLRALRAGAAGFLLKDTPPDRLVAAVRAAADGEPTLSPSVMSQLMAQFSADPADGARDARLLARRRLATLTDREREVAAVLAEGLSNAEIAARLYLSVPTVKTHVSRILDKLGAANRVQAAIAVHDAASGGR